MAPRAPGTPSSDKSDLSDKSDGLIPRHGGYRRLRSFQVAEQVYDATTLFCDRFIDKRSRTHDQMVQAARSGRQNIAEGSVASATSKKTELKLTNVARASLEELLLDYEDFLRQRRLRLWPKDSPEARAVRDGQHDSGGLVGLVAKAPPEVAANAMICLVNQTIYLLHRQIQRLERDFLEQGGFTERLYRKRTEARSSATEEGGTTPPCPVCGKPMSPAPPAKAAAPARGSGAAGPTLSAPAPDRPTSPTGPTGPIRRTSPPIEAPLLEPGQVHGDPH
jgi:restriction system protein